MRILFIAPEIPWPLNKGTCQRSYAILKALSIDHSVTLSAPAGLNPEQRLKGLEGLIDDYIPVPTEALARLSLPKDGSRLDRVISYVKDLMNTKVPFGFRMKSTVWFEILKSHNCEFDAYFCRYSYLLPVLRNIPKNKVVIDVDDVQYVGLKRKAISWKSGWESLLIAAESLRTYLYEKSIYSSYAQAIVCSKIDQLKFKNCQITIIRNGVDLPNISDISAAPKSNTILFLGAFTYGANVEGLRWFIDNVWTRLRSISPNIELNVVGFGATKENLGFACVDGVNLIGEVADPRKSIIEVMLTIVPIKFGTGSRIKIAESLGCGRPVVSTVIGAEGYEDFNSADGLITVRSAKTFAESIAHIIGDHKYCIELGIKARKAAESQLAWEATTASLNSKLLEWISKE